MVPVLLLKHCKAQEFRLRFLVDNAEMDNVDLGELNYEIETGFTTGQQKFTRGRELRKREVAGRDGGKGMSSKQGGVKGSSKVRAERADATRLHARWEKQFAELWEYKTLHGHASPFSPGAGSSFKRASEVDKKIGLFASQQRRDYKVRDVQMPA